MTKLRARLRAVSRWKKLAAASAAALVAVGLLGVVAVRDIQRIDPTSGGYDAPYEDFTGEPIDWLAHEHTGDGFRDRGGILLETSLDCTTGQIRAHVGPLTFDYRKLSDRAIAVHKPHVACVDRGFEPEWSYPAADLDELGTTAVASATR